MTTEQTVPKVDSSWQMPENFTGCVEFPSKDKYWFKDGKFHREDGPAVIHFSGDKQWWLHGNWRSESEWSAEVAKLAASREPKKSKMKTNKEMFVSLRRSLETISQKASDYIEKYSAQFELEMEDNHLVRILVNAELCGELSVPKAYAAKLADALKDKFTALGYVTRKTLLESDDDNNCYSYSVTARIDYEGVEEELAP